MKRAHKFRAYPTQPQTNRAFTMLNQHCELYNAALEERIRAWKQNQVNVNYGMQSAQLKHVREARPEFADYSFTAQQQTLRRLKRSMDGFFRRVKKGETPGFPRFRSYNRFDTVDHVNGDGAKWCPTEGRWARAYFQGVGNVKVSEHRHVEGRVTQVSLKREGRKWFVILIEEFEPEPLPVTGQTVGIDLGIVRFYTDSNGGVVDNPRFLQECSQQMAELQQTLARCKRGSGNYKRTRRRIGKLHRKIRNRRLDFHHKQARQLVKKYDSIAVEKLNTKKMMASEVGTIENPNSNSVSKRGLNRSIADVGWAQFVTILEAKVRQHEPTRAIVFVNPAYTSINCHKCGSRCERPQQDTVICSTHGRFDADLNGALNVFFRAGLGSVETVSRV